MPKAEAEGRAWATENKVSHGGRQPGESGRGKVEDHAPLKKTGRFAGRSVPRDKRVAGGKTAARARRSISTKVRA